MASTLIPCAHCGCHAKIAEATCPSCGEPLRRNDGSVPRTAVAVLLGLTATSALAGACGVTPQPLYGPATTTSSSTGGAGGGGGTGGAPQSSTSSSTGGSGTGGSGTDGG